MIRREIHLPGTEPQWALISQVDHAHLAADLARRWQFPLVPGAVEAGEAEPLRGELLQAIEHHDDGWAEWEDAPDIDPKHGRPRSFTEMPQADSLAIWSKSIAIAERIGPLPAWVVSAHFSALLQGAGGGGPAAGSKTLAGEWIDQQRSDRDAWMHAWLQAEPARTKEAAEYGLRALQFFDAVSLWFCCGCPAEGEPPTADGGESSFTFADGRRFQFSFPPARPKTSERGLVSIQPWPLDVEELHLSVDCHQAPRGQYATADDLLRVWEPCRLTWRLIAPSGK